MKSKIIIFMDTLVILASIFLIVYTFMYIRPEVKSPLSGYATSDNSVLFSFKRANILLIDDTPKFISPEKIYIEDQLLLRFNPGTYYWKIEGISESETHNITILSNVDLKIEKDGELFNIINAGNERLLVDKYNQSRLIEKVILNEGETTSLRGDLIQGGIEK